jgi:hypothetical protein
MTDKSKKIMNLYAVFLCLVLTTNICNAQDSLSVSKIARTQSYRFRVTFQSKDGHKAATQFGYGIILKGKYLATCYHAILSSNNDTLKDIYLFFNERHSNNKYVYDSVGVDLKYKAQKGQYDFSKHRYDPNDYTTDFVVLKLSKKIPGVNYKFNTTGISFDDSTFAVGNERTIIGNTVFLNASFVASPFFCLCKHGPHPTAQFLYCLGDPAQGFSGTPLFNKKGEVLGVIQFGYDELSIPLLDSLREEGCISYDLYDRVINSYKNGHHIFAAIDITFLKDTYLKGYL